MAKNFETDWVRTKSYFRNREQYGDGMVAVTEITRAPDGNLSRQRVLVAETANGWRMVMYLPAYQSDAG